MSSIDVDHGTASVRLVAALDVNRGTGGARPSYAPDDVLAATAAVLRAARDTRADAVAALINQQETPRG